MTTPADSPISDPAPKAIPKRAAGRRARLGWYHALVHRVLLIGRRVPDEPTVLVGSVPESVRELVLLVEEHRSHFAAVARSVGADYKGGYWMMYLITPLAVACSATAVAGFANSRVLAGVELLLIVAILMLFVVMRRGGWQETWIRARRTAEHLRYLPLVAPFVGNRSANWYEQMAAQRGLRIIVDPEVTRVCAWLASTPGPEMLRLEDPVFFAGYARYVADVLTQQIRYHAQKAAVEHALGHRVGFMSTAFFVITFVCTAVLFLGNFAGHGQPGNDLRLFATVLPAIGAGLRGILAQGESHRVATLSEGMVVRLTQLREQLESLPLDEPSRRELENIVWNALQELLSEADTWMRLQESAPLSVAG